MKESHYNMYMTNVETLDTTMGHHCAAASTTTKRNLNVDLGKCVKMFRAPFLYLPGAPNSLNPPLSLRTENSPVSLNLLIMLCTVDDEIYKAFAI